MRNTELYEQAVREKTVVPIHAVVVDRYVELLEDNQRHPFTAGELEKVVVWMILGSALANNGIPKNIEIIMFVRRTTGWGLKEAKNFVDAVIFPM